MEPTPVMTPRVRPAAGSMLSRGLTAVVVNRTLPYQMVTWGDRLLRAAGWRHRVVRAGGFEFVVRRGTWADESIIRHVVVEREYHPPGYEVGPADVVIDVGANIGGFSVPAAKAASSGWVIAYEPEPANAALLRCNLDRNACRNVTVVPAAVAGRRGEVELHLNPDNSGGHSAYRRHAGPTVRAAAVTLRDVFDAHRVERCDLLKLDCEGAEYDLLYTLPRAYFGRIRRIALEYHADPEAKREAADGLVRHLHDVGFRVDRYTDVVGSRGGLLFASRGPES